MKRGIISIINLWAVQSLKCDDRRWSLRFFYLRIKVNNEHKEIKFMGNNTMKMTKYKRWVLYGLTGICLLGGFSCTEEYDDTWIKEAIEDLQDRVTNLEDWCQTANSNISSLRSLATALEECDYITVHVPATEDTKGMINREAISLMKKGVVLLNFARDVLVDEEAVIDALVSGQMKHYVTDFPTPVIAGVKGAIVIPHLGASTGESEDNCARMAVRQLRDYLENGNITNSVNYPNCEMGRQANTTRIVLLHHNVPNMIGQFTKILARDNMNIADLSNKSKGEYAYTMIDIDNDVPESVADDLRKVGEVLRVRIIH